ncbi:MAG: oligoendopeptidase F [Clostridiales bacterium]|jgi:oligoendopeptidase F|nr:oligoendopeptidase F [Clostridiales bacterium]
MEIAGIARAKGVKRIVKTLKKRLETDPAFKWNVNDLVSGDDEWQSRLAAVTRDIGGIAGHKAVFTQSAGQMLACLRQREEISRKADTLYVYAVMRMHEDNADTKYQGMADQAENMVVKLMSAISFIEPSILSLDEDVLYGYLREEPDLAVYTHYIEDLLRQKDHVLSPEMEELLANAREIGAAPDNIFTMLTDADMKYGMVHDENGEEIELTHGRYVGLLESHSREVRREAFETLYAAYAAHKNTLAASYSASVKKDVFFGKARKYAGAMEASLSRDNIPRNVYTHLIQAVNENLPSMHRYIRLRKKALNLPELHMYDIYTPIVPDVDTACPYDEAKDTVLKALSVMGADYTEVIKRAYTDGWIDVYENGGKHSGAYSWGAYGCHPYILLNYNNKLDDMFTVAHEIGHAMHSYYTWNAQPYLYSDYSIFLAEVASTVNEALLTSYLRETVTDKTMLKYLLNHFLEQFRTTVFRQTMFAEFEMATHQMAEEGKPLTVDSLSGLYRGLNMKYYGEDMVSDPQIDLEWSRIPHFYNAFYVFQYATGFSAAAAFSKRILERGEPAVKAYKEFLKSGSSDYPINVLRKAGVDMEKPAPVREAMRMFSELVSEMETLI